LPEYRFEGLVEVPQRIIDGFNRLGEEFERKMGFKTWGDMMQPQPGVMDEICVFNPIRHFNGQTLPELRACLNFEELSQQGWVSPLRMVLLFMIVCMFISSIVTVLRQA